MQLTTNQALNEQLLAINKLLEAEPEGLSIARGVIDGKPFYKVERPIKVIHPKE